jgi:hypothetical protein
MAARYDEFIANKLVSMPPDGIENAVINTAQMFPFQRDLTQWALRRGRCAIFADTGLGKMRMELFWAARVWSYTGKPVLILAPLAVAAQIKREAELIGVDAVVCRDGKDVQDSVNVTNYERLHRFDSTRFGGVVLDESSCIKHFESKTLSVLLDAFGGTPFKLCASATPAPNDYTELGTHSEFLGICRRQEMLSEFFCHDGGETQTWRLKGHARPAFWRWVASWGALVRLPSDLGYEDADYLLPPLAVEKHTTRSVAPKGYLFPVEAATLAEQRAVRKASLGDRVAACAALVNADNDRRERAAPAVVW